MEALQHRTVARLGDATVALFGDLDLANRDRLHEALVSLDPSRPLTLDLSGVGFIDSTGVTALVAEARRWREAGGSIEITGAAPQVRRVLDLTGLSFMFAGPSVRTATT